MTKEAKDLDRLEADYRAAALESDPTTAERDHRQRVEEVLDAIGRGAAEKMWSVQWQLDYGLRWDHERQVWVAGDGFAYEAPPRERVS